MAVVSHRARLIYVAVPKIACTSIKSAFWRLETQSEDPSPGAAQGDPAPPPRKISIHQRPGYKTLSFARVDAPPEGYEKVLVVRDPLARTLSAWRNKVGYEIFRKRSGEVEDLENALLPLDPTFPEFVRNYEAYRKHSRPARVHTEELSYHVGPDLGWYDAVFRLEELDAFVDHVSARCGAPFALDRMNESGAGKPGFTLDETEIALLRRHLAADYALLSDYYDFDTAIARLVSAA